jgi:hypothetical protein
MMTRAGMHAGFHYADTPAAVASFVRLGQRTPKRHWRIPVAN